MEALAVIRIDSLAFGGDGVGRIDGKVCFVPFSLPGDLLSIQIVDTHPGYLRGQILEVLKPGAGRRAEKCRHFGVCGGCQWQHLDYRRQIEEKRTMLAEQMRKIAGIEPPIHRVIPSPEEYHYRSRARLRFTTNGQIGYFARSSNDLVAVEECPILAPPLEARLAELRQSGGMRTSSGSPRHGVDGARFPPAAAAGELELSLTDSGELIERVTAAPGTTVLGRRGSKAGETARAARRAASAAGAGAVGAKSSIGRDDYSFHQINRHVNPELVRCVHDTVVRLAPEGRPLYLLDLYCGNGNLSLPLARRVDRIHGVDASEESIREAAARSREAKLTNVAYSRMDVAAALSTKELSARAQRRDSLCIIADPPRSGLKGIVDRLASLRPELLIYISCAPPALARDARLLAERGLALHHLVPFDMFPQTFHLETMAVFTSVQNEAPGDQGP